MSQYRIERANTIPADGWNRFVDKSVNGTLFHRLDFLAYHKNKFKENDHCLAVYKGEAIVALLPLGIFKEDGKTLARSPFGASWGGLVYSGNLKLRNFLQITELLLDYLVDLNVQQCYITPPPQCYYNEYDTHFEFALFNKGFQLVNREVTSVSYLEPYKDDFWQVLGSKCRNSSRKALEKFEIIENAKISDYYPIIEEDKKRHDAVATHSFEELSDLTNRFPKRIYADIALHKETGAKAVVCFFECNALCTFTFYIAQEDRALRLNGVNAILANATKRAIEQNKKYIDFGPSSIKGEIENIGVSDFKESFGAKGFFRDTYLWERK